MMHYFKPLGWLLTYTRRASLIWIILITLAMSFLEAIGIGLIFPAIKLAVNPEIITENQWLAMAHRLSGIESTRHFSQFVILLLALFFVAKNAFVVVGTYWQTHFCQYGGARFASEMLRLYLRIPYEKHLVREAKEQISMVHEIIAAVFNSYVFPAVTLISEVFIALMLVSVLFYIEPTMTLVVIVIFGVGLVLLYYYFKQRMITIGNQATVASIESMGAIRDGLQVIKEAKVVGCENHFWKRHRHFRMDYSRCRTMVDTLSGVPRAIIETMLIVLMLTVEVLMMGSEHQIEEMLALLSMFAVAALRLTPSINRMVGSLNRMNATLGALKRLEKEYFDLRACHSDRRNLEVHPEPLKFNNQLMLDGVGYHYPNSAQKVLHDLHLTIRRGESVAFVGASGTGKSTAADIILGLLKPTEGRLLIDDVDVHRSDKAWYGQIGYVPQSIHLLNTSLKQNIAFGVDHDQMDEARLQEAIKTAHLQQVIAELPQGLDTFMGEDGSRLSGGQKQRVAIARALYHNPDILLLDEATSALDMETERDVSKAIEELAGKLTLIIIAHRLSTVYHCDRIVFFKEGRIDDVGTFQELKERNRDFERLVKLAEWQKENDHAEDAFLEEQDNRAAPLQAKRRAAATTEGSTSSGAEQA